MDITQDVGSSGRDSLHTTMIFENWPVTYADVTGGTFTLGLPGVTVDCHTSGQPQYSNNMATPNIDTVGADVDNPSLAAPGGPVLFIAVKSGSALDRMLRLSPMDITDGGMLIMMRKVITSEDCANPAAYRWIFCGPLIKPG